MELMHRDNHWPLNRWSSVQFASFGIVVLLAVLSCAGVACAQDAGKRPNILYIMADDLGWGDLGSYGNESIATPNLDALASGGMQWTQFYAASAVCSPTRASVLTGRYPIRFGITTALEPPEVTDQSIPGDTLTIARLLKEVGYSTAHIGKWHLGPNNQRELGFDRYTTRGWKYPYPRKRLNYTMYYEGARYIEKDGEMAEPSELFLTDYFTEDAIEKITAFHRQDNPFFINLWYYSPHAPYNLAPDEYSRRYLDTDYRGLAGTRSSVMYRSMVTAMDMGIGRIVAKLKELGILEETLIVFASDNGSAREGSPGPWTGGKASLYEGGIRVPMIAYWPGIIPAGSKSNDMASTIDILPTLYRVASGEPFSRAEIDGVDLVPRLTDKGSVEQRDMYWQMDSRGAFPGNFHRREELEPMIATEVVRRGDWKLFAHDGEPVKLVNLKRDPEELLNMMTVEPEVVQQLSASLRRWLDSVAR